MNWIKKILIAIVIVFIIIQFIQPARNISGQVLPIEITKIYNLPDNVQNILKTACYDCHSNNTNYPWYANIQPVAWWMSSHINDGKIELNFSEFGSYSPRLQRSKLKSIATQINDGEMPIWSYTLMHKGANLTKEEKTFIMDWATKTTDSLSSKK